DVACGCGIVTASRSGWAACPRVASAGPSRARLLPALLLGLCRGQLRPVGETETLLGNGDGVSAAAEGSFVGGRTGGPRPVAGGSAFGHLGVEIDLCLVRQALAELVL